MPRLCPSRQKFEPIVKSIEGSLGVEMEANGRLAFRSVSATVEIMVDDPGTRNMPKLEDFISGAARLPLVVQFDATGFRKLQLTTLALRNPYMPKSSLHLRVFGLGNCADDKADMLKLLGDNRDTLNRMILAMQEKRAWPVCIQGVTRLVHVDIFICTDLSALRHTEHLANSGFCGCSRFDALRLTPTKPHTLEEMYALLKKCHEPTCAERFTWSHMPHPGEELPRPCTASGCTYAHKRETAAAEMKAMLDMEAKLAADPSKKGKAAFTKWRMAHAHAHLNVQPGKYGEPLFYDDFENRLLDALRSTPCAPCLGWARRHGSMACSTIHRTTAASAFRRCSKSGSTPWTRARRRTVARGKTSGGPARNFKVFAKDSAVAPADLAGSQAWCTRWRRTCSYAGST